MNADGDLVISARRHCAVDALAEDSPVNESPCASQQPQYSVGRVRLVNLVMPATDFEWGFEVRLPDRSAPGTRSALWLINVDQIYCDPLWGELDVLEWYSSRPDRPRRRPTPPAPTTAYTSWHHKPETWAWGARGRRLPPVGRPEADGRRNDHPALPVRRPGLRHRHLRGAAALLDVQCRARPQLDGDPPDSSLRRRVGAVRGAPKPTSPSPPSSSSFARCGSTRSSPAAVSRPPHPVAVEGEAVAPGHLPHARELVHPGQARPDVGAEALISGAQLG